MPPRFGVGDTVDISDEGGRSFFRLLQGLSNLTVQRDSSGPGGQYRQCGIGAQHLDSVPV